MGRQKPVRQEIGSISAAVSIHNQRMRPHTHTHTQMTTGNTGALRHSVAQVTFECVTKLTGTCTMNCHRKHLMTAVFDVLETDRIWMS